MFDAGCFCGVGLAPECCSFSRAVNPRVGSRQERWGLCNISFNMQEKVSRGNQRSSFCFASVSRGVHLNLCYWLENLDGNYLWLMPDWLNSGLVSLKRAAGSTSVYRAIWRKRARILTNCSLAFVLRWTMSTSNRVDAVRCIAAAGLRRLRFTRHFSAQL